MARQATVYQVFVSSPSDVEDERKLIESAVSEWNQLNGADHGVLFEVVSGYTSVAPAFADRPQSVINDQIGEEYDIYLGLMWMSFGSDTGSAPSGTVEEFRIALNRFEREQNLYIGFFFKVSPPPDLRALDGSELSRVQDFKKSVGAAGGFYAEFSEDDELRQAVNRVLRNFLKKKPDPRVEVAPQASNGHHQVQLPAESQSEDLGWLDVQEELTEVAGRLTAHFAWITSQTQNTNGIVRQASDELERLQSFGEATPSLMRPVISRVATAMEQAADGLRGRMPEIREDMHRLPSIIQNYADISEDFVTDESVWSEFVSTVTENAALLLANADSTASMITTTRELPRMTKEFNSSRRKYVAAYEELISEMRASHITMTALLPRLQALHVG
jgi:hypothetical protein